MDPAPIARRVLVVGGGPAGMEAARIASLRGHVVTLVEAHPYLGGQLAFAARTYEPNAEMLAWLTRQMATLGVDVRISTFASPELIATMAPDVVVDATGGMWPKPDVPGAELPHVRDLASLRNWVIDGEPLNGSTVAANHRVVIVGGGRAGCGLATLARSQGHEVTVLEATNVFMPQLGMPGRWRLVHELQESGVTLIANAVLSAINESSVRYAANGEEHQLSADVVITVASVFENTSIEAMLAELPAAQRGAIEFHRVGDCTGPRFLEGALLDATEVAVKL